MNIILLEIGPENGIVRGEYDYKFMVLPFHSTRGQRDYSITIGTLFVQHVHETNCNCVDCGYGKS